jgi:hypothetical protein
MKTVFEALNFRITSFSLSINIPIGSRFLKKGVSTPI